MFGGLFIDGFIFGLLYTQKEITKDFITAKYNNITKKECNVGKHIIIDVIIYHLNI